LYESTLLKSKLLNVRTVRETWDLEIGVGRCWVQFNFRYVMPVG